MAIKEKIVYVLDKTIFQFLSDKLYLKIKYRLEMNKKLNLENPQTFNEKLQWLKLYDRKDIYTTMVDKYEAKKYVADSIGEEYIIPTIGIYDKFDEIDFEKLPNQFVMKCTHDSGGIIICRNKKEFNQNKNKKKINKQLRKNFYKNFREWPYKNVKPRIIIEKYMKDTNDSLIDYKFMCFNGKVKCIFVCSNRHSEGGLNIDVFDTEWNKMVFGRPNHPNSKFNIPKPKELYKMIELAEELSEEMTFIRVDFYEIRGKIYFSELTFFPGAGFEKFTPDKYDEILGSWINLKR